MHFWNDELLTRKLLSGNISERGKINYYLASIFISLSSSALNAYIFGLYLNEIGLLSYAFTMAIIYYFVVGIHKNICQIKGLSTIEAIIIVGVPALAKVTVINWLLTFLLLLNYSFLQENHLLSEITTFISAPAYFLIYFKFLAHSLNKIKD